MASLITPDTTNTLATRAVKDVYVVSRLVREARVALEGSFPLLWVEGEVSNLAMPASGHIYFTLKDEIAQVRCAMFRNRNRQLRFTPKNGMQVLLRVRITLYEGRGEFQLSIEHMEEAGSGALQRAFEALKFRLGEQGLFAQEHKKVLPLFPETIGIVSSPDGAAVHDVLTVLKRRFPAVNVILYPVAVQGGDSVNQIASAIKLANERKECDLLIVGRGGGSIEDLWSFNDEKVARALFESIIPTISAVGHEVDFTIADFVADVRAATPSAAAELAVPDVQEMLIKLRAQQQRLNFLITDRLQKQRRHIAQLYRYIPQPKTKITQLKQQLNRLGNDLNRNWRHIINAKRQQLDLSALRLKHPQAKIDAQAFKLTNLVTRLQHAMAKQQARLASKQKELIQRLQLQSPVPLIKQKQYQHIQLNSRLTASIEQRLHYQKSHLSQLLRTLAAVSPLNTLERGYSITTSSETNNVIHHADEVSVGQHVNVRLQQGQLKCEIKEISND